MKPGQTVFSLLNYRFLKYLAGMEQLQAVCQILVSVIDLDDYLPQSIADIWFKVFFYIIWMTTSLAQPLVCLSVALDRYLVASAPNYYGGAFYFKHQNSITQAVCVFCLFINCLLLYFHYATDPVCFYGNLRTVSFDSVPSILSTAIPATVVLFVAVVLIVLYYQLLKEARSRSTLKPAFQRYLLRILVSLRVIVIFTVANLICWMPLYISIVVYWATREGLSVASLILHFIITLGGAIHIPVLYTFSRRYRTYAQRTFCRKRRKESVVTLPTLSALVTQRLKPGTSKRVSIDNSASSVTLNDI